MADRSDFETEDFYNQVYDLLIEHAGALDSLGQRESFVYHFAKSDSIPTEWRFQGSLGFGGKFWRNDGRIYVTCYPEDQTPARRKVIEVTNKSLEILAWQFISRGSKA